MERIKIKYFSKDMPKVEMIKCGDWVDLRVSHDCTLYKDQFKLLGLGVAMELPNGYEAIVAPRSSTFIKYGILQSNSIGIIDESYCGNEDEWMFPAYATRDVFIPKHTRICQFRLIRHQPEIELEEVKTLNNKNRGGFGSTGN